MNVDEKLEGFMRIALDEAMERKRQVLADMEEQYTKTCDEYRFNAEEAAKKKLKDAFFNAQRIKNKKAIQATADCRKAVLDLRNKLLDKVFDNVEERLRNYTETPEYTAALIEDLKNAVMNVESAEIYLMPNDFEHVRGKINFGEVSYVKSIEDFIGGYKMKFNDNALIDNTYKTKLNDIKRNTNIFKIE